MTDSLPAHRFSPPMSHEEDAPIRPRWSHHMGREYRQCGIAECRAYDHCAYEKQTAKWVCPDCAEAWDEESESA